MTARDEAVRLLKKAESITDRGHTMAQVGLYTDIAEVYARLWQADVDRDYRRTP